MDRCLYLCCVWIALVWVSMAAVSLRAGEDIPASVMAIAEALSSDEMGGRSSGSTGSKLAQAWLTEWMRGHGFRPAGNDGDFLQPYNRGSNLVALVGPEGAPAILLSAHYDHVGSNCSPKRKAKSNICNGAADNAAAVAAVLTAAAQLDGNVNATVAVALWDGEELGFLGAKYFLARPTFSLANLRLIINIDVLGIDMFHGMEQTLFCMGGEIGGPALTADVAASLVGSGLHSVDLSYAFGHGRSDPTAFIDQGVPVPIVFLSDGSGPTYHTTADEFQNLNLNKITSATSLVTQLALRAASRGEGYGFVAPTMIRSRPIPRLEDANALQLLVQAMLSHADANGLDKNQRKMLHRFLKQLKDVVDRGVGAFGVEQHNLLLGVAAAVQQMSQARSLD